MPAVIRYQVAELMVRRTEGDRAVNTWPVIAVFQDNASHEGETTGVSSKLKLTRTKR